MSVTLEPNAPPGEPEPYSEADLQSLPVYALDRPITIPPPLSLESGLPVGGEWLFAWGTDQMTCPDGTNIVFERAGLNSVSVEDDGAVLVLTIGQFPRIGPGLYRRVYSDAAGNLHRDTLQIVSMDRIAGEAVIEFVALDCTLTAPFSLQLLRGVPD
jgi:hypothetical protein